MLGGTGAIGQAICRLLAAAGHAVHFTYGRREEAARTLARAIAEEGGRATFQQVRLGDGASFDALEQALARMPGLCGAVYASGPDIEQPYIGQVPPARWSEVLQQDVMAFLSFAHLVLPALRANGGGSLVAVTTAATQRHAARDALSSVPKAAVEAAVRGIAKEEGRYGIRANCVAPGMLETGLGQRILANHFDEATVARIRQSIPLQHFGTADDVAAAAAFLLSAQARYVTGQTLCVDGGWSV